MAITGANGFTGQHLERHLTNEGVECVPLSRWSHGDRSLARLATELADAQPECVFHLAGVAKAEVDTDFFQVNTLYAVELLRAMREANLKHCPVLLVGSGAEYGQICEADLPLTEETQCHPFDAYGISKYAQTLVGLAETRSDRVPIVMVRPFNVIGRGMPQHLVLGSLIHQIHEIALGRSAPKLFVGNLEAKRDFIDVRDVVRIYWNLVADSRAFGHVFNVCTGVATSIGTLLQLLTKIAGIEVKIEASNQPSRRFDIPVHYGSNKKLLSLIGGFEFTPLPVTLRNMI